MSFTFPANVRGPVLFLELPSCADAIALTINSKTSGKSLTVNLPEGWSGADLTLDFAARTVVDSGGTDRSGLLDPVDNSLWTPAPLIAGENDLEFEAIASTSISKSPGTVVNASAGAGSIAWENPNNAKASDDSYATAAVSNIAFSQYLKLTNYGFAIPSTAQIVGRQMEVEGGATGEGDLVPFFVKGGAIEGALPGLELVGAESVHVIGTPTNLVELGWVPADVNSSGFGAAIRVDGRFGPITVQIDTVTMRVYYRPVIAYAAKAVLSWNQGYY